MTHGMTKATREALLEAIRAEARHWIEVGPLEGPMRTERCILVEDVMRVIATIPDLPEPAAPSDAEADLDAAGNFS